MLVEHISLLFEKMKSEKQKSEKKLYQHLYKYYDVLHWGEDFDSFLNENITLFNDYNGQFIQFGENNEIIGGLIIYFNPITNSNSIGCAAIDSKHRGKGYFRIIIKIFIDFYPRLYLFCQPHLLHFYSQFFKYQKQIKNSDIYLISNYEITIEDQGPCF